MTRAMRSTKGEDVRTPPTRAAWAPLLALLACGAGCESRKVPEPTPSTPTTTTPPTPPPGPAVSASASRSGSSPAPSDAAADTPQADPLPAGSPRFVWKVPLSVGVEEDVEQAGQQMRFAYHLDVCPGEGGNVLVSHRGVTVTQLNGVPVTGKDRPPRLKQIEAAASNLPTMVVDHSGAFLHGTGYPELIKHATTTFPGPEFAELREFLASGQAPPILDATLRQLWQAWVGVWLRFDPTRGASQDVSDADPKASVISMSYGGLTPEHRVKLAAHRVPTQDELAKLAGVAGGADAGDQAAVLDWNVETDWPDVRPWRARSRRIATATVQGKEQRITDDHLYRFDWQPSAANKPRCAGR